MTVYGRHKLAGTHILLLACVVAFVHSMVELLLNLQLPFCGPNMIDHYFYDVNPPLKIACTNKYFVVLVVLLVMGNTGMIAMLTFAMLLISYIVILVSLRTCSPNSRCKALSTCSSHVKRRNHCELFGYFMEKTESENSAFATAQVKMFMTDSITGSVPT
ncbi:olfactory receptor 4P4-like [Tachyglossus aculeatus]|uniref:olfactory receptor 4P4-like n=1 Tax=Tachyglossus aculeatus TaxID=9261 RepID=UPI0018F7A088|nr:olfactory receptor 4P4-like [Tachyglossus aculeatus]